VLQKQLAFYLIHFEVKNIFKNGNLQKFKELLKYNSNHMKTGLIGKLYVLHTTFPYTYDIPSSLPLVDLNILSIPHAGHMVLDIRTTVL
jgi:hypothetical protein